MSSETKIRINTGLLVFSLATCGGALVTWGTLIEGQKQTREMIREMQSSAQWNREKIINHEEKLNNTERRVGALERKTGLAGDAAGVPFIVDGRNK